MSYYNHPERLDPIIRGGDGGIALAASWFENIVKRVRRQIARDFSENVRTQSSQHIVNSAGIQIVKNLI